MARILPGHPAGAELRSAGRTVRLVLERLFRTEDLVAEPPARIRSCRGVEEDTEGDTCEEQGHVSPAVRGLALGVGPGLAELLYGLLQLDLEILVLRNLEGHARGPAGPDQLVVDLPCGVVCLLDVVVQVLVTREAFDVRPRGVDRVRDLVPHSCSFRRVSVRSIYPGASSGNRHALSLERGPSRLTAWATSAEPDKLPGGRPPSPPTSGLLRSGT